MVLPVGAPPRPGIGRTRAVLVAAAARAFAEHGLRACTMQAVAAAAGVSKGTLYNYFRTKEELVRALLAAETERLSTLAAELPPEQAPDTLTALVDLTPEAFAALTARLAALLETDEDGAGIAARWLLGVLLQPARSSARHRAAARLAAVLSPAAGG